MARYAKQLVNDSRLNAFFDAEGVNFPQAVSAALGRDLYTGNTNNSARLWEYVTKVHAAKIRDGKPLAAFVKAVYDVFDKHDTVKDALANLKSHGLRDKSDGLSTIQQIDKTGENVLKFLRANATAISEKRREEKANNAALLAQKIEEATSKIAAINAVNTVSSGQIRAEEQQKRLDEINATSEANKANLQANLSAAKAALEAQDMELARLKAFIDLERAKYGQVVDAEVIEDEREAALIKALLLANAGEAEIVAQLALPAPDVTPTKPAKKARAPRKAKATA